MHVNAHTHVYAHKQTDINLCSSHTYKLISN